MRVAVPAKPPAKAPAKPVTGTSVPPDAARVEAERKAELARLEDRIDALEKRWDDLVKVLNDPLTYKDSKGAPLKEYKDVERELESLYEKWGQLAERPGGAAASKEKS
jgi:hypothetical protein